MFFTNSAKIILLSFFLFAAAYGQTVETRRLAPDSPVEADLGDGEKHVFSVNARAGDFVRVVVEQTNADVSLIAHSPDGAKFYETDNSDNRNEAERVSFVTAASGEHLFEIAFVRPLPGIAAGKGYRIRLDAVRPPTIADKERITAERLYDRANLLRFERAAESRRAALAVFAESLPHFRAAGDRLAEGFVFYAVGQTHSLLSEFPQSRENYARSREIFRELNFRAQYARATANEATIHNVTGDLEKAAELCLVALAVFREIGDRRGEAEITGNLGVIALRRNAPRRALEFFNQALPILQAERDRKDEARILRSIALTYDFLGEPYRSVDSYEKALAISRDLDDRLAVSSTLINYGSVVKNLGEGSRAAELLGEAVEIVRKQGDKRNEAAALNNLGVLYYDLGETETAADFYQKALTLRRELKMREPEAEVLANLGSIALAAGDLEKANETFAEVLKIARETKNRRIEARTLVRLGEAAFKTGDRQKALALFNEALPVLREIEDREWEGLTLFLIGETQRQAGDLRAARESLDAALKIKREMKTPLDQALILKSLAQIERAEGDASAAQISIENALEIVENLRAKISRQDLRSSLFSSKQDFYELYIELLVAQGKNAEALRASERARARSLLESLGESQAEISGGVAPELLAKERRLRQIINAKDTQRINALRQKSLARVAEIDEELAQLSSEYQQTRAEIRAKSPAFAALTEPEILSLIEIQTRILDDETVLLEYSLGAERSFLFAADRRGLSVHALPGRAEIERMARTYYENVRARGAETNAAETLEARNARLKKADAETERFGVELSRVLLAPVAGQIKNKRLLIVGAGVLQYLPFASLNSPADFDSAPKNQNPKTRTRFLIETNEIVALPSASALAALRKAQKPSSGKFLAAVLADPVFAGDDARVQIAARRKNAQAAPDAPGAEAINAANARVKLRPRLRSDFARLRFSRQEAEAISAFTPAESRFVRLDFAADLNAVGSPEMQNARVVHFATHGFVNSSFPELSGIALSLVDESGAARDGYLRLHDIYNLRLNAGLVVLSACETALGKEIRGEGIVGLTRGFMYAGARSVAASLWKVDDRATAELMRRFYQKMLRENLRPSAALRAAQVSLAREKTTENPFYWAAFTLQGEYR